MSGRKRTTPLAHVDNVRPALEWCFGVNGDLAIGVGLAAAAAPVFLAMSLLPECHTLVGAGNARSRRRHAWGARGDVSPGEPGGFVDADAGQSDAARMALNRGLAIAEARGDVLYQVGLLGMLSMFEVRDGDFKTSLHYARAAAGRSRHCGEFAGDGPGTFHSGTGTAVCRRP